MQPQKKARVVSYVSGAPCERLGSRADACGSVGELADRSFLAHAFGFHRVSQSAAAPPTSAHSASHAGAAPASNQVAVRDHYDARKDVGVEQRTQSPIFRLKGRPHPLLWGSGFVWRSRASCIDFVGTAFNNWIKSVLIDEYLTLVANSSSSSSSSGATSSSSSGSWRGGRGGGGRGGGRGGGNAARERMCVLDLCGGKGGDLKKWEKAGIGYLVLAGM
jgi:hypothetical protein